MKAEIENVDPELAAMLLENMLPNRSIREPKVQQFAADMKAGRWKLTGEAIKVTDVQTGADLSGKHPIRMLRKRLEENALNRSSALDHTTTHALVIKAWNAYREGREVNHLGWRRGGSNPEAFPALV